MTVPRWIRCSLLALVLFLFAAPAVLAQGRQPSGGGDAAGGIIAGLMGLLCFGIELGIFVLMIAGMWKTFSKAGKPGWAAIIPIYNIIVLLEIIKKPIWWVVLFLIPLVNFIISILVNLEVAKFFGKGAGFAIGMIFLPFIFWPMLGFGDAKYNPNAA